MTVSVYLHVPFCSSRCGYCDFNTYAGLESLIPEYVAALEAEIRLVGASLKQDGLRRVRSVYFGGGTPSLLEPQAIERILTSLRVEFQLEPDAEVTLEANPGTVDLEKLRALRSFGLNRLSMGAQSSQPDELALLERTHSPQDVERAVAWAQRAGFSNVGIDLMYGLPDQSLERWMESVRWALGLGVEHLSLYGLTLEYGTPLRHRVERRLLPTPDPDLAAEMYESASSALHAAGFVQYEISNWAKADGPDADVPDLACRHNLQYWRNEPYLGLGAGAHGYALGWRYHNVRSPRAYIDRVLGGPPLEAPCSPAAVGRRRIDEAEEMDDTMLLGFRMTSEGIRRGRFLARFGVDPVERYGERLRALGSAGLVEHTDEGLRLTPRGRILGNQVFQAFV